MGKSNMDAADFAVVHAWIGSFEVHSTEDHIIGLQVNRKAYGVVYSAIMTLYDDTALQIETLVKAGVTDITFQYGWNSNPSPVYRGVILNHRAEFRGNSGASLRLEISSAEVVMLTNPAESQNTPENVTYKDMKLEDIVQDVASRCGWNVKRITPCEVVPDPNKEDGNKTFIWEKESGMDFIRKKVQPHAYAEGHRMVRGEWGYDPDSGQIDFSFRAIDEFTDDPDTYWVGGQDEERVISWAPVFDWGIRKMIGASELIGQGLDKMSNEYFKVASRGDEDKAGNFKVTRIFPFSGDNSKDISRIITAVWKKANAQFGKATLTITGDPLWEPTSTIRVVAYTKYGVYHHSSAYYVIDEGEDVISNAGFVSTLHLTWVKSLDTSSDKTDIDPTVTEEGTLDEGPTKAVNGTNMPKSAGDNPGQAFLPHLGAKGLSNGKSRGYNDDAETFPVSNPRFGDIVIAKSPTGIENRGLYVDKAFVKVLDQDGIKLIRTEDFTAGREVSYRRGV